MESREKAVERLGIIGMALLVLGSAVVIATRFASQGIVEGFTWLGVFLTIYGAFLFGYARRS